MGTKGQEVEDFWVMTSAQLHWMITEFTLSETEWKRITKKGGTNLLNIILKAISKKSKELGKWSLWIFKSDEDNSLTGSRDMFLSQTFRGQILVLPEVNRIVVHK